MITLKNDSTRRFGVLLSSSLLSVLCLSSVALALTPSETVSSTVAKVKEIVSAEKDTLSTEALDEKLRGIIIPVFDFKAMARGSLARHWKKASPEQQEEFTELFSELLGETYLNRIRENATESEIVIESEKIKDPKAIVKTDIKTDGSVVNIDYRMRSLEGKWLIYDVIIENIGLVSNYRSEFNSIVKKSGVEGIIEKLKAKKLKAANTKVSFSREHEMKQTVVAQLIREANSY